jgi:RNA polymerase sigma-70 factor (ECF subfamily)
VEDVEDILQEIAIKLCSGGLAKVPADDESTALRYIAAASANTARDYYRARFAVSRDAARTTSLDGRLGEILPALPSGNRELLLSDIDRCLGNDERSKAVFWLYYRQGYTAAEIARIPSVCLTAKGVESLIHRLTATVRHKLQKSPENAEGKTPSAPSE